MTGGTPATLTSFVGTNGKYPENGLTVIGSTLFGTTEVSDAPQVVGTVFSLPVSGGTAAVLVSFNGSNGESPLGSLTLSGTTFYGTTLVGGENNRGTVFSAPVSGGNPNLLCSFGESYGIYPGPSLVLSGTTLYGYCESPTYGGTLFSLPVTGGTPTTIISTSTQINGLILSGTVFYGVIGGGGFGIYGSIFRVNMDGSDYTDLYDFTNRLNGDDPNILMLSSDGSTLYGTTLYGGATSTGKAKSGDGTVFALSLNPTPEPSTLVLLAAGTLGLAGYGWRRRAARSAKPTAFDQPDAPAILPFPSAFVSGERGTYGSLIERRTVSVSSAWQPAFD